MLVAIAIMVALTTIIAGLLLAPRTMKRAPALQATADRPRAFGYKMSWLAIRTTSTPDVIEALGLTDLTVANWQSGIGAAYSDVLGNTHVFISPPVQGWTFVVGLPLPPPLGLRFHDACSPFLLGLGGRFNDVQYFFSYPPIDYFAWARVIDGRLVRSFAASDEGVIWSKGRTTTAERTLGLRLFDLRGVEGRQGDAGGHLVLHPTEDHVMRLAAAWSLDPTRIETVPARASSGYVGRAPAHWRAKRVKHAA